MLCTEGHNNSDNSQFCSSCGIDTFQPGTNNGLLTTNIGYNGFAIASMVLGIIGLYVITSILAIIFGFVARKQIETTRQRGQGMATAGIVLGIIWLAFLVVALIVGAAHN